MLLNWIALWGALSWPGAVPAVRQEPDSALLQRLRETVNAASDTLDALRGLTQAFRTDLPTASSTLVLARATSVHDACASGASAVRRLQGILAARTVSPAAARSQAKFRTTAEETVTALDRCVRTWLPLPRDDQRADSLRAWGPYRIAQLDQSLRRYDAARQIFAKAAGLTPTPKNP
jgi:hypothetical protein